MVRYKLVKNKDNRPYTHSIKYRKTVIAHIPDYLDKKIIKSIVDQLNRGNEILNLQW